MKIPAAEPDPEANPFQHPVSANPATPIAPRLEPVLRRLRQRIRKVLASRGTLISVVTALAVLLALVLLDVLFAPLPPVIRWLCPFVWAAAVITVATRCLWLPLHQPLDLIRIARWLEIHHPELDERISTVLEVSGHDDSNTSLELLDNLARHAVRSLDQINPQVEVSNRRVRQWAWPAAALAAVWLVMFLLWPAPTARHIVRALVPTSRLGNDNGRITVTPGSRELFEGDPFQITAHLAGAASQPLDLILHLADGTTSVVPLQPHDGAAVYQIGRAVKSFDYEVRTGRQASDRYKITVWPQPRLTDPRLRLEFPAYTGWADREQTLGDGVAAITGTRIDLRSKLNTPVVSQHLLIDGQAAGITTVERGADGGILSAVWTLEKPGHAEARVMLKHRLGREFEAARFTIETRPDAPPEVKWLGTIAKETRLRPDDLLEQDYQVSDDVGLGAVQVEVQPEPGEAARLPLDVPPRVPRSESPLWRGKLRQPVGALVSRWPKSPVFKLRMRAEDSRPASLGGPGVGVSGWLVVRIDSGAPSQARQQVAATQSDARDTIEQTRQLVQQAREKIDRDKQALHEEKIPEDARKDLAQAREQLAQARAKLEDLADRMKDSVQAAKAPEVKEAAQTVEQARQQLENAPLQDTPQARDTQATLARDSAAKAEKQLEKLRDEIQRDDPKMQDYAKLKELEQQQHELARQAEQAVAQNQQDPATQAKPAEPWKQQQERVAEAIRQDTQQESQAQAAALDQQAREAKQLASEAREQAAAQETLKKEDARSAQNNPTGQTSPASPTEQSKKAAKQAADLAEEIRDSPQVNGPSGPLQQAAQSSQQAAAQAQQAAQADSQGKPGEAANNHGQAAQQLQQAAAQLDQAAAGFAQQAADAAGRQPNEQQAPVPGQPLAQAFEQAAAAAHAASQPSAASHAEAAANALSQAADATLTAMQSPGKSGKSAKPGEHGKPEEQGQPGKPGTRPDDSYRPPQHDPGVPPELAKLGVSAADWEKIKASLKSDVGGSSTIALPAEYRDLARRYFEEISKDTPR